MTAAKPGAKKKPRRKAKKTARTKLARTDSRQSVLTGPKGGAKQKAKGAPPPKVSAEQARRAAEALARAVGHHQGGRLEEAVREYSRAAFFNPGDSGGFNNLGVALRALGRLEAAVASYRRALELTPDNAGFHSNLGNALRQLDRFGEALAAQKRAVKLAPRSAENNYNLGLVYRDTARVDEAIACFDAALAVKPDYVDCRWDRSLLLLQKGRLKEGFEEYEWRWKLERNPPRGYAQPVWDGSALNGRTLLVHQEQGFGDMIQMVRFMAAIKAMNEDGGGTVMVECQPELKRLFAAAPNVDRLGIGKVVVKGEPIPRFDVYAPMLSIPRILGTSLKTLPVEVPYLALAEAAPRPLAAPPGVKLKVGLSWAGKPTHTNDRHRSCPLARFMDLARVPNVAFYSLQKGAGREELKRRGCPALIADLGGGLGDFADTAAVLSQLDLVITVDTSVAHLAGAMARPVWVVLPFAADWRWLRKRANSPWYPTMTLFRQPAAGDWDSVFVRLEKALRAEVERLPPPAT